MSHSILAFFSLGGLEIILLLALLLILALVVAAVVLVSHRVGVSQKKPAPAQPFSVAPPPLPTQPQDLDQQLRTLAKLRDDGVITEDDFNAKKKALLGI
jgi:hypothetical protein